MSSNSLWIFLEEKSKKRSWPQGRWQGHPRDSEEPYNNLDRIMIG